MPGASTSLSAQPELHHFSNIAASPEGIISLRLGGSVSSMFNLTGTISNQFMQMFDLYPVEASTNLTDWTRLALLLRTNNDPNRLLFQDRNFAGLDHAFCRTFTNHLITMLPKPSGPFAVGTLDRVMIDPARTNLYRYHPGTNTFMVTFWYPAEPPAAGVLPAPMWDRRFAGGTTQPRARCKPGPQNSMITASSGRPATGAPASRTDSAGHSAGPRSLVEARGEATSAGHHRRGIDTPAPGVHTKSTPRTDHPFRRVPSVGALPRISR